MGPVQVPISSRFVIAVHVLTLLEVEGGRPVTSEEIAASVNTNPGFIRRVLSMLARAGLVVSQLGAGGGTRLAKPAKDIQLADVYRAVESGKLFTLHHSPPNPRCLVGRHIQGALSTVVQRAESALEEELGQASIAQIVGALKSPRPGGSGNLGRP
jgi:Rrf2 family protein